MDSKDVWAKIVSALHNKPQEFQTIPMINVTPRWFRAYSDGKQVLVESAIKNEPSSKIKGRRALSEAHFNEIYPIYLRREKKEKISNEATVATHNSVYFYSLIKYLGGNEKIICRICWNSSDWKHPTEKSPNIEQNSFVAENGYGHEEWLFRLDWLVKGKHYAYLQPIGNAYDLHKGKTYDIVLYSYTSEHKEHWIGGINNVYVPLYDEIKEVYKIYKQNGWIKTMKQECKDIKKLFVEQSYHSSVINICFDPADIWLNDPIIRGVEYLSSHRYSVSYWNTFLESQPKAESAINKNLKSASSWRKGTDEHEFSLVHNMIQQALQDTIFPQMYGSDIKVLLNENNIDVKLILKGKLIYIEIKKARSAREAIRQSIGQLLEYVYHSVRRKEVPDTMVIMGVVEPLQADIRYLNTLNEVYGLIFHYCYIDTEKMKLEQWID